MKKNTTTILFICFMLHMKLFSQSVIVDGVFNEPLWENAIEFSAFKQLAPDIGAEATEQTNVFVANDSLFLYFKVICYDSEPDQLRVNLNKRDNLNNDDTFTIEFEANGNTNSNNFFRCNPLGIQEDGMVNQKEDEDLNQDKIWQSKGLVNDNGYQLEIAIPFQSLRYKWDDEVKFKIGFRRKIFRKSEELVFPEFNPQMSNRLRQRQEISLKNVQKRRLFEIIPEVNYKYDRVKLEDGWKVQHNKPTFGITGKVGIKSDLILDLTYNPDFSQIEADAGKVDINLRNALYFAEKRPFFQEGQEQYQFGGQLWRTPLRYLVHTRNIIEPLYGVKLSGNLSPKYTISSIISSDKFNTDMEHYQVARVRRLLKEDNYIGATYTGKESKQHSNRVGGLDGLIRLNGNSRIEYNFFASQTTDSSEVKQGNNFAINYDWRNKIHTFTTGYYFTGKDFNTEVGYVTRSGLETFALVYNGNYPLKNEKIRKLSVWINLRPQHDRFFNQYEFFGYSGLELYFNNDSWLWFGRTTANEVYQGKKFKKSDWSGGYFLQLNRVFYLRGSLARKEKIYYDPEAPFQGYGWDSKVTLQITPTEQLIFKLSGTYSSFLKQEDKSLVYDYTIGRVHASYQVNKYLFLRGIGEYNAYKDNLNGQFLFSFVYIPGTAVQFGYNVNAINNVPGEFRNIHQNLEVNRSTFFFKASYLFRR